MLHWCSFWLRDPVLLTFGPCNQHPAWTFDFEALKFHHLPSLLLPFVLCFKFGPILHGPGEQEPDPLDDVYLKTS